MYAVPNRYEAYAGDSGTDRRGKGKMEDLDRLEEIADFVEDEFALRTRQERTASGHQYIKNIPR